MNIFIKREYDYALRICAYLANYYRQGPIPLPEISRKLLLSRPFANKIVHRLKKGGLIATTQGRFGGVYLNLAPDELSLFDVLQCMGFNSTLNECVQRPEICPLSVTCQIHQFFVEQEAKLIDQLKSRKIAEFAFGDTDLDFSKIP